MNTRRKESYSVQILQMIDAVLVWVAFWIAAQLKAPLQEFFGFSVTNNTGLDNLTTVLFVAIPSVPLVLECFGFYRHLKSQSLSRAIGQMLKATALVAMTTTTVLALKKVSLDSRLVFGTAMLLTSMLITFRQLALFTYYQKKGKRAKSREPIMVVGSEAQIVEFKENLTSTAQSSVKIVHEFIPEKRSLADFEELLIQNSVGRVVFVARDTDFGTVGKLVSICEIQGIEAWISAGFIHTQIARPDFDNFNGRPMIVLRSTPELSWAVMAKDFFDRFAAFCLIVISFPLWLIAFLGIKLSSPQGSAFFQQQRAGRYGMPFAMWKFRTMVPDAEGLLNKVKEDSGNEMSGPVFKLQEDPRVFKFGSFLRRTSIDELPQLLNVFLGDMSLVGPRPLPLYEVEEFEKSAHRRRLSVKPGITCIWQVEGRNKITDFEDWVKMDLDYIDNWSLWLDFKLLLKTVPAVFFGRGAK